MLWLMSILGMAAVLGLTWALVWAVREVFLNTAVIRLERRLSPGDVFELNQAFARVRRDVLDGD